MDKFHLLSEIVKDYILHMQGINEMRAQLQKQDLKYTLEEVKLFNLLQQNMHNFEVTYGIPQNQ